MHVKCEREEMQKINEQFTAKWELERRPLDLKSSHLPNEFKRYPSRSRSGTMHCDTKFEDTRPFNDDTDNACFQNYQNAAS